MHIGQIGHFSANIVSGASNSGARLCRALADIDHDVIIFSPGSLDDGPMEDQADNGLTGYPNITTYRFPVSRNPFSLSPHLVNEIKRRKRMGQLDVVHLHSVFQPLNFIVAKLLKELDIPIIWSPRGGLDPHVFHRSPVKKYTYWHLFERKVLQWSWGIHCLSIEEQQRMARLGYQGTTEIVFNGICHPPLTLDSKRTKNIVYLGRGDIVNKGLDRLMDVFQVVAGMDRSIALNLYGCCEAEEQLSEYLRSSIGLRDRVFFHEAVFGDQKWQVLREAGAYIQASRWEAFGNSIAEAMLSGTPIILSRECSLSRYVREWGCGVVLEDFSHNGAKQIVDLLCSEDQSSICGRNAQQAALRHFDTRSEAHGMTRLYQKSIDRRPS